MIAGGWEKVISRLLESFGATHEAALAVADIYAAIVLIGWEYSVERGESESEHVYGGTELDTARIHAAMCTKNEEVGEINIRAARGGVPIPQLVHQYRGSERRPRLVWQSKQTGILQFNRYLLEPEAINPAFEARKQHLLKIVPPKIYQHNQLFSNIISQAERDYFATGIRE